MQHLLKILDHRGHTELSWNPEAVDEVDTVRERFEALMRQNFVAYDLSTSPGEIIKEFRPQATEILVTPEYVGG
jgi:hypothetical protein